MHNCNLTIYWNMMERISWTDHARNVPRGEYPTYNEKKKADWIGHFLYRKRPLKHVTDRKAEGRIEVARWWWGSTRSHSVGNLLWKRLWTCYKIDYKMNEWLGLTELQFLLLFFFFLQISFLQNPLICLILQFTHCLHRCIILPVR